MTRRRNEHCHRSRADVPGSTDGRVPRECSSVSIDEIPRRETVIVMRLLSIPVALAIGFGLTLGSPCPAEAGKGASIAGGIIAGAAVGAAISSSVNQPKTVYVPVPVAAPAPPPNAWGQVFSPNPHINCYPAQRACYNANGAYNGNWTYKVYAR